jgi:hypothetical protein
VEAFVFSRYIDELFEDKVSARLVVEAFTTCESPLGMILLGDGIGFSTSLSLSLDIPRFFGLNLFKPFLDSFSSLGGWTRRGNAAAAAVVAAALPIKPFLYCCSVADGGPYWAC